MYVPSDAHTGKCHADAGTHRWTHTAGTPVHAHRRCTRTDAYVLRKCVPSKPRAPSSFSSASPTGETAESSVEAALSAATLASDGRLPADAPADAQVMAVGRPFVCPCVEVWRH